MTYNVDSHNWEHFWGAGHFIHCYIQCEGEKTYLNKKLSRYNKLMISLHKTDLLNKNMCSRQLYLPDVTLCQLPFTEVDTEEYCFTLDERICLWSSTSGCTLPSSLDRRSCSQLHLLPSSALSSSHRIAHLLLLLLPGGVEWQLRERERENSYTHVIVLRYVSFPFVRSFRL